MQPLSHSCIITIIITTTIISFTHHYHHYNQNHLIQRIIINDHHTTTIIILSRSLTHDHQHRSQVSVTCTNSFITDSNINKAKETYQDQAHANHQDILNGILRRHTCENQLPLHCDDIDLLVCNLILLVDSMFLLHYQIPMYHSIQMIHQVFLQRDTTCS
jgi:hypothetical protein